MLQFFGGSAGAQKFDSAPSAGKPTIAIGNGTFGGGAAPDFQGTSALGINMVAGYVNDIISAQIAGVSIFEVKSQSIGGQCAVLTLPTTGASQVNFGPNVCLGYAFNSTFFFDDTLSGDVVMRSNSGKALRFGVLDNGNGMSTLRLATDGATVASTLASATPLTVLGIASQTADLFHTLDSGAVNHFGIANVGTGPAPIWALRVAPVANAASMAQTHVGGASTGKAIQVIDNTGTSLGWLQLVA